MDKTQPCSFDPQNPNEIIQHFRDLFCIGPILIMNVEDEIIKLKTKLKDVGWDASHIHTFEIAAASSTFWEEQIPRPMRMQGNQWTYKTIKARKQ